MPFVSPCSKWRATAPAFGCSRELTDPRGTVQQGPTKASRELGEWGAGYGRPLTRPIEFRSRGADAVASSPSFSRSLCHEPPFPLENLSADAFLWRGGPRRGGKRRGGAGAFLCC